MLITHLTALVNYEMSGSSSGTDHTASDWP